MVAYVGILFATAILVGPYQSKSLGCKKLKIRQSVPEPL